jgi:hypothetical protein
VIDAVVDDSMYNLSHQTSFAASHRLFLLVLLALLANRARLNARAYLGALNAGQAWRIKAEGIDVSDWQ